jgi:hypothetical protein
MRALLIAASAAIAILLCLQVALGQAVQTPGTSYSTALELTPGEHSFSMEAGDTHFFYVRLEKEDTLYLTLRSAPQLDFDVALVSPDREVLELSLRPAGFSERIVYRAYSSGDYYIVVFPFGASAGSYNLLIEVTKPRTATTTTTRTLVAYVTVTEHEVRNVMVQATREVWRTVTVYSQQPADQSQSLLGWSVLSLALIAVAVILRDGLMSSRRVERKEEAREKGGREGGAQA